MSNYIDSSGAFLGGWSDPSAAPVGAIEVPDESAPDDARQKWNGTSWNAVDTADLTNGEKKLMGVLYDGVMCSATKEDMWGLKAVEDYVAAGQDTPFQFDNGNVLLLTQANMAAFQAVWVPFRASFF